MKTFYIVLSIIIVALIFAYVLKYRYTLKIRKIRDNIDFTTKQGKFMINELNRKLDIANGFYRIYK